MKSLLVLLAFAGVATPGSHTAGRFEGGFLLPDGQVIHPAGRAIVLPARPVDIAASPYGSLLAVKDNQGIEILSSKTYAVLQKLPFPAGGGSMHGIVFSKNGSTILADSAQNSLYIARRDGKRFVWKGSVALAGLHAGGAAMPCGIALSRDGARAWVCNSIANTLVCVNLRTLTVVSSIPTGAAPWTVALSASGGTAYVSDWGGRHARKGEASAFSAGTPVPVDSRGIADTGEISVVNLRTGKTTARIPTGLHPCDLQLNSQLHMLYCANANSDTISVINTLQKKVVQTIAVHPVPGMPFGSAPDALALDAQGRRLYVAAAGNNAAAVYRLNAGGTVQQVEGWIPTGWYPGSLALKNGVLYVADVKGRGARMRPAGAKGYSVFDYAGTVDCIRVPSAAALKKETARVLKDLWLKRRSAADSARPAPLPLRAAQPSLIRHVVYIIRENRTYDQVLGDMRRGNGDPKLVEYGENITPNAHALARQYVLLDNYYCNGTISADGHSWLTEGNCTDHLEKAFGGFTRSYTFGDDPVTYSSSGFIWDDALDHGLSVENFGELDYALPFPAANFSTLYRQYKQGKRNFFFAMGLGVARLKRHSDPKYPGWNLSIPDQLRASIYLHKLREYEKQGKMPALTLIYLPQDHTSGTRPGFPTPAAMVADNDLALGRIVSALSKSRFWKSTCIFVTEDDAQDGLDHVDGHRSVGMVISPYTRRGRVVNRFYNQTSILRTLEHMLGLPPMNQMDARAPLMTACFMQKPNLTPYQVRSARIPLGSLNPPAQALHGKRKQMALLSMAQNWSGPDEANETELNHILWAEARGVNTPYPVLAGH